MPDLDIGVVVGLANLVGARVAREYPGITAEDITQEAITALYEKSDRLTNFEQDYLYTVMYEAGNTYAARERYDYLVNTASYLYTPKEVKAVLEEAYFDPSFWEVPTHKDDYLAAGISGQTDVVCLSDMQNGFDRLSGHHTDTLVRKYRDGGEVHRETLARAVDALTRAMNVHVNRTEDTEGPGVRKALSNAQAQHQTRQDNWGNE